VPPPAASCAHSASVVSARSRDSLGASAAAGEVSLTVWNMRAVMNMRAGRRYCAECAEKGVNARSTNTADRAEGGRVQRRACPLERWLEGKSTSSASRARDMVEIRGDRGRSSASRAVGSSRVGWCRTSLRAEYADVRAGRRSCAANSEHRVNTREASTVNTAEYGRVRPKTCPLER